MASCTWLSRERTGVLWKLGQFLCFLSDCLLSTFWATFLLYSQFEKRN